MSMVDSFGTRNSYSDVPEMRESRRRMLTALGDAITETVTGILDAGPENDAAACETLDLLAEVYDLVKNGSTGAGA